MDDISPEFKEKGRRDSKAKTPLNPSLKELVKLLARVSAKRDYNMHLQEHEKPRGEPQ